LRFYAKHIRLEAFRSGEVQNPLNQKMSSKSYRTVDFVSRFVMIIENMNFELRSY
jgi:hypothetical protein